MDNSASAEKAFALIEIAKIANYRFSELVADANVRRLYLGEGFTL